MSNSKNKVTFLEGIGVAAVLLFFAGIFFYLRGADYYKDNNGYEMWLPILMGFPFIIQIPIFLRFYLIYKKDKALETFFSYYTIFMCVGLSSYSFFWWTYNTFDIESWESERLTFYSILSLLFILFLIWGVVNCTRVITRGSLETIDGLLNSSDLTREQYEEICNRLDTLLKSDRVVECNDIELRHIIQANSEAEGNAANKEDLKKTQKNINKILTTFSDTENISFPVTDESKIKEIISVVTDINQPAQIKPLKRILLFLREDNNIWIHRAITSKDFHQHVTKQLLIKSINKILKNAGFFDEKEFSSGESKTPAQSASLYFKNNKNRYFLEQVQLENRNLLNEHILNPLKKQNPNNAQVDEANGDSNWVKKLWNKVSGRCWNIVKLGLTSDKGLKIKEGIARFPFETMSFFFTIVFCITYLFSFSFAFHDKSRLKDTLGSEPALFMTNDFSDVSLETSANPVATSNSNANVISNTSNNSTTNFVSTTNALLNSEITNKIYRHPTLFVFYAPAGSGIETGDLDNANQVPSTSQKNSGDADYMENRSLQAYRYKKNKESFKKLVEILKETAPAVKSIYVEIVGRADDNPQKNLKQTYSSNYELSMARAQNLKFELIRNLQDTPNVLEKIEWSCLPVSNDQTLGGDHPLSDSDSRPSIALNNSSNLDAKDMIKRILEQVKVIPEPDADKKLIQIDEVLEKKKHLLMHVAEVKKLLEEGKITNKSAGEALFSKLKKELEVYASMAGKNPDYEAKLKEFTELREKTEDALNFFKSGVDNANKRVTEIYITATPKSAVPKSAVPRTELTLMDFILYTITIGGYADVKPLTIYSKFLSIIVNIANVFFLVVFFNVLLSVKRVNEEDENFNSA